MRVVVFGASGVQGSSQVRELVRKGHHAVAVSRNPKPLELDGKTVETAAVDIGDRAAVEKVLQGAEAVLLNLPSTSFNVAEPLLKAAKDISELCKANDTIKVLVFNTSMPVPKECQNIKAQDDRREMKKILRATGLPVISVQPVCYVDNLLEGWAYPSIRDEDKLVYVHRPGLRASWICHDDCAQVMVAAMTRPDLAGQDIVIGGPETVQLYELTEKLSRAWGRELECVNQTVDDFCEKISKTMQGRGLETERIVSQMHKAYSWYNDHDEFIVDMGPVLKEFPSVKLHTLEEWGRTHVPAFTNPPKKPL